MSTKLLAGAGFLAVAVFSAAFFLRTPVSQPTAVADTPATTTETPAPVASAPAPAKSGYTLAQVAGHNSSSSCWTAINGGVYDVTAFISQHPGGAGAILSLCGRDGSAAFNAQHGGQRRPASELASFYVAPLIN